MDDLPQSRRSLAVQALGRIDEKTRAVVPPLHLATTFIRDPDNGYSSGFVYGRPDNETIRETEAVIAMLEDAPAGAMLFGSGMAAATACFMALEPGDHVVASSIMYWGLRQWLLTEAVRWGLEVELVDTHDLPALAAAMRPGAPSSSGSRHRPIRSGRSRTSQRRLPSPIRRARCWRSIPPAPHRFTRARFSLAPISSCTPRPRS
jgi:cystathionine beta-lyase/cystathionine gamma-synthase